MKYLIEIDVARKLNPPDRDELCNAIEDMLENDLHCAVNDIEIEVSE